MVRLDRSALQWRIAPKRRYLEVELRDFDGQRDPRLLKQGSHQ
jgi:hypothetical protein